MEQKTLIAKVPADIRQLLIFGSHRVTYGRGEEEFLEPDHS
jgi:hypothetical protein